jgi:3-deoxy-D-manno-octulosonic acid (KDO) 8-phosphate synthase
MIPVLPKIKFTGSNNFFLIAGPCVVENRKVLHEVAAGANMLDLGHLDKLMFKLSEIRKTIYKLDKK